MLILPSLYEAIPMVLLEAMAYGKPIVASRVGGIPEFVLDGKNGYLVDPRNSDELAEKISRLVEDSELRTRIGSYNTRYVEKKYSLKMMVNKTLEAYERLLS
jgi:glycosyltransferase involved in cell wall biosynthesis